MIKLNLNKLMIILCWIFAFNNIELSSFPGDHNSLTCINNLFIEPDDDNLFTTAEKLRDGLYSSDPTLRAKALAYIEANKAAIKAKIKRHQKFTTDVTKWGDSLSDWVDLYVAPYNQFGFIPSGDFGGLPGFFDSWGDYFTIFGNAYADPFTVDNYGTAGEQSSGLLARMNVKTFLC